MKLSAYLVSFLFFILFSIFKAFSHDLVTVESEQSGKLSDGMKILYRAPDNMMDFAVRA